MPSTSPSDPEKSPTVEWLFSDDFTRQVRLASTPIIPAALRSDHEYLVDQAVLKAYEHFAQFGGESREDLLGWVLRILQNLTRDILRSHKDLPSTDIVPTDVLDQHPAQPVATEEEPAAEMPGPAARWKEMVLSVLGVLPPNEQEVLRLRFAYDLSIKETAARLSEKGKPVSEAAVKMRQGRALRRIIQACEKRGLPAPTRRSQEER